MRLNAEDGDMKKDYTKSVLRAAILVAASVVSGRLFAALDESCVVNILNRTVQVGKNGGWSVPNLPSNMGRIRARATCIQRRTPSNPSSSSHAIEAKRRLCLSLGSPVRGKR